MRTTRQDLARPVQWSIVGISLITAMLLLIYQLYFVDQSSTSTSIIFYSLVIAIPAFLVMLLDSLRDRRLWFLAGGYAVVMLLLSSYSGYQCSPAPNVACGRNLFQQYVLPQGIAWFILLFFARTWLQQRSWRFPYPVLFDNSWDHYLVIKLTGLFVGIFWGLLLLWSSLFELIGIGFFEDLFFDEPFAYPATGFVVGIGVIVFRSQINAVEVLRRVLRALMRWLLPVLVLMALLFLVSLPFTGLEVLWKTRHATLLLLWLISLVLFFLNAVYQDRDDAVYPRWIDILIKLAFLAMPIFVLLAAYALGLRVAQYGWTVDRLWAAIITLVLAGFVLAYGYALLRQRSEWFALVVKSNRIMAASIALIGLLVASPILDLQRISSASQVSMLKTGKITLEKFDLDYLHFQLGRSGYEALMELKVSEYASNNPKLLAAIDDTLKKKHRWDSKAVLEKIRKPTDIADYIDVYPDSQVVPEPVWQLLYTDRKAMSYCFTALSRCLLLAVDVYGDGRKEFLLLDDHRYLYNKRIYGWKDNGWRHIGIVNMKGSSLTEGKLLQAIRSGDVQVRNSEWKTLVIGGRELVLRSR